MLSRTRLARKTPLARGTKGLQRSPLRPVSLRKLREKRAERKVWEQVKERDKTCRLTALGGTCFGPLTPHHVKKASQGGRFTLSNIVAGCAHHNGMVENEPALAYSLGFVVKPWEAA